MLRTTWKTHHSVSGQCRFLPSKSGMCYNRSRKRHIVLKNPGRKASDVTGSNCIHIGQVIRHAVVFNTQRWPEVRYGMDNLLNVVSDLFDLPQKRRIRYALVGDVVLLRYVQGRNTGDIDLILSVRSLKRLPEVNSTHRDIYFARGDYRGLRIDVLLTNNPFFFACKEAPRRQAGFF